MNAEPMNSERAYAIIRDITAALEARGEKTKTLSEVPQPAATLYELGVDLTAFSELIEELSLRFNGKDFHLQGYLIPEEYYYLTVDKLVTAVASAFKTTCKEPEVVYVDDEEENLFVFKRKFGKKLKVKTFTDPKAALLYVQRSEDVKLVITDEVMPGMSGNELCDAVHDTKPLMKFILITGNPNSDDDLMYRALRRNRFFEFFNKPVDFDARGEEYLALIDRIVAFE
jgi:CheY-like chemotaxis protein